MIAQASRCAVFLLVGVVISSAGCASGLRPSSAVAGVTDAPVTPSPRVATLPPATPTAAVPTPQPPDSQTEEFPRDQFTDPATIDNEWLPLKPGTRWVFEGAVGVDERMQHSVIITVTDLTKVIDGVLAVVAYDEDLVEGELVEAEVAFFAQADDGTVWQLGEHPEEYDDGVLVEAPTWIAGLRDAKAGIMMKADPQVGSPSYSEGWGPAVGWTDRGRVFEVNSRTCVPVGCYDQVLIIDEFNPDEPDAHQLKYYARGIGNVRVGWAGALETNHEELGLISVGLLTAQELKAVRDKALALEAHAYEISPDVYGRTQRATRR